jgi:GTP-binding protein
VTAEFVLSAAAIDDLPTDGLPELALVGRSNVGKSSLINALTRQRIARTSGAPGKTRLANVYRVARAGPGRFYLVDLPGYGYARGGAPAAREFEALTRTYFGRASTGTAALLLVDARHPGLEQDLAAWQWLKTAVVDSAVVATKIDKLARGARSRALARWESVLEVPVTAVSAATGEGLKDLWILIDQLLNRRRQPRNNPPKAARPPRNV